MNDTSSGECLWIDGGRRHRCCGFAPVPWATPNPFWRRNEWYGEAMLLLSVSTVLPPPPLHSSCNYSSSLAVLFSPSWGQFNSFDELLCVSLLLLLPLALAPARLSCSAPSCWKMPHCGWGRCCAEYIWTTCCAPRRSTVVSALRSRLVGLVLCGGGTYPWMFLIRTERVHLLLRFLHVYELRTWVGKGYGGRAEMQRDTVN